MKCARCGHDSQRRDRSDGNCPNCKKPFAFEPQTHKITDVAFQNLLADLSAHDTLKFSRNQLYHAFNKRLGKKIESSLTATGCLLIFGGILVFASIIMLANSQTAGVVSLLIGITIIVSAIIARQKASPRILVAWSKFDEYLDRWTNAHGQIKGLLVHKDGAKGGKKSKKPKALPDDRKKELSNYSFDRLLVVEHDAIAEVLIENRFHFENNCAILSLEGFPGEEAREVVLDMAKKNHALKIFIAHDASVEGCKALERLRRRAWFDDKIPVIDLGLRPAQAMAMKTAIRHENQTAPAPSDLNALDWLTSEERAWLGRGFVMHLEAFGPAALMRALHQGFARTQMLERTDTDDGGALIIADPLSSPVIWAGSGNYDQYASDSFG